MFTCYLGVSPMEENGFTQKYFLRGIVEVRNGEKQSASVTLKNMVLILPVKKALLGCFLVFLRMGSRF